MRAVWWDCLRFVALGALLLGGAYAVSEWADPVYPEVRQQMRYLREQRGSIEAVAVGSSHAGGLDFAVLGMQGFHLARGGSDLFQSAYVAHHVAPQLPVLRYLFVSVSYTSLWSDNAAVASVDMTSRRREIYARTHAIHWIPGDLGQFVAGKAAPIVRPDHWRRVMLRLVGWRFQTETVARDGRVGELGTSFLAPDALSRHASARARLQLDRAAEADSVSPDLLERTTAELHGLARRYGELGIRVVFFTSPYSRAYTAEFDPELLDRFRDEMSRIVAENAGAAWVDFSEHPELAPRLDLFNNSDHLNAAGAAAFSTLLRECLRGLQRPGDASARHPAREHRDPAFDQPAVQRNDPCGGAVRPRSASLRP